MSRRFTFTLEEGQYDFLTAESFRSSIAVAELIRRAIDRRSSWTPPGGRAVWS